MKSTGGVKILTFKNRNQTVMSEIDWSTMLIQGEDGILYYKVGEELIEASMTDIQKHYKTMQYNLNWTLGLWATDRKDLVIDIKEVLFQLEYTQIPENCERIK